MKILHIIPTLDSGGAEKMLVDVVEEMQKQKVSVEILVLSDENDFYSEQIKALAIPIYFSPINIVYHPLQLVVIKKYLKRNFDIVHSHLFAPQLYVAIVKTFVGCKSTLITTEHNTHNRRREKKYFKFMDSWMYKRYKKIIAITEGTKEELNNYLPNTSHKTIVIQNGIRLEQYTEAKALPRENLINDYCMNDKIILMVAAMREQKDHETLIRTSRLLPENYQILFVGDGDRLNEVKEYANKFGSDNIHFLGRRSDVPSIMKTCDIFVLSSKWEGFGLVALEAMAAGLPVVVSDVTGLREVVEGVGTYFEVGNENDLKIKILSVNNKKIYQSEFDKKANVKVLSFSIGNMVLNYLKVYMEVSRDKI